MTRVEIEQVLATMLFSVFYSSVLFGSIWWGVGHFKLTRVVRHHPLGRSVRGRTVSVVFPLM